MVERGRRLQKMEQMIFDLRDMYADYGYAQFRIRKFEEYDLYVRNKDFLDSVNIITFTDTNGKLMALKPDVTLSVVKNSRDIPGAVQKVYYNENIYRVSRRSHMFEELTQVGIEAIGDMDDYDICEVLALAAKTLQRIAPDGILVVSDLDILSIIFRGFHIPDQVAEDLVACLGEKNVHTLQRICRENGVDERGIQLLTRLSNTYGRRSRVLEELADAAKQIEAEQTENPPSGADANSEDPIRTMAAGIRDRVDHLKTVIDGMGDPDLADMIRIDFSVVSDVNYYNGIVFNGFVRGIPECIISGGQYDRLMKKMKRASRAIGFGVYMERLERFLADDAEYDIDIALIRDEGVDPGRLRNAVDELIAKGNRVLVQRTRPEKLRYRKLMKYTDGEVEEIE